jgi:hypothetical protein
MPELSASKMAFNVFVAAIALGAAASLCVLWVVRQFMAGFFFALGALVVVAGVVRLLE